MSIEDKGKSFGVFYTDDGIKCLNNETGMEIMKLIEYNNLTLAELSRELKLPVSTVLFNTNKLEEKRLIASYRDSEDRRKVYYTNISLKILVSCDTHPEYDKLLDLILEKNLYEGVTLYRSLVGFACTSAVKTGIDIGPLVERVGRLLGQLMVKEHNIKTKDDACKVLGKFFEEGGCPHLEQTSSNPLTIRMRFYDEMPKDPGTSFRGTIGMVCAVVEELTGKPHMILSNGPNTADTITFTIEPVPEHKTVPTNMFLDSGLIRIRKNSGTAEQFCISIDRDKCPRMINNPAQISIIEALAANPDTLKGLNKKLGGSQSTLFSNLTKLENAGIIYTDRSIPGSNVYRNYGMEAMSRKKDTIKEYSEIREILLECVNDPKYYYRSIFKYFMVVLDATGIDSGPIQEALGRSYARIFMKKNPEINADNYITTICSTESVFGTTFTRESYIPLTITMENSLFLGTGGRSLVWFYIGELSEVIYRTTKRNYIPTSIKDLSKGKGKSVFKFVLEPEIPVPLDMS